MSQPLYEVIKPQTVQFYFNVYTIIKAMTPWAQNFSDMVIIGS
jgi:hypothetical protein